MLKESPPPLILIVDDEPTNIMIMAETLRASYRINVATSGQAALDIVGGDKPDLTGSDPARCDDARDGRL